MPRYNLYPAAEIDGAAAPGYSQGQAIAVMDNLAAETLPDGFATEWTTLAFHRSIKSAHSGASPSRVYHPPADSDPPT